MDTREIYSIQDGVDVLEKLLKEELGLGYNTVCAITDQFRINFLYIWIKSRYRILNYRTGSKNIKSPNLWISRYFNNFF